MTQPTKQEIYDELSRVLTDYEHEPMSPDDAASMLYDMLVKIQNNWEEVITADDYLNSVGHYLFPF